MPLELWLSFCLASLLIIASPGPAVALLVATGVNRGRRAALAMLPGFFLGDLLAMTLSFAGVGALLMASAELFQVLKWLGAAYLLYLASRCGARPASWAICRPRARIFGSALPRRFSSLR